MDKKFILTDETMNYKGSVMDKHQFLRNLNIYVNKVSKEVNHEDLSDGDYWVEEDSEDEDIDNEWIEEENVWVEEDSEDEDIDNEWAEEEDTDNEWIEEEDDKDVDNWIDDDVDSELVTEDDVDNWTDNDDDNNLELEDDDDLYIKSSDKNNLIDRVFINNDPIENKHDDKVIDGEEWVSDDDLEVGWVSEDDIEDSDYEDDDWVSEDDYNLVDNIIDNKEEVIEQKITVYDDNEVDSTSLLVDNSNKENSSSIIYEKGMSLLDFLKQNKGVRDIDIVLGYYSMEEIKSLYKKNIILIKKNKIIL